MFKRALKALQPSLKYAVFTTAATLVVAPIIINVKSVKSISNIFITNCDGDPTVSYSDKPSSTPTLIEQADAALENKKLKIRTPMQFENIKNVLNQASVHSFDGFRYQVQKQINLNTVVSHFFWMGSQTAPPIYQYRIILPYDDKMVSVATDADFNVEGEVKVSITPKLTTKVNFVIGDQAKSIDVDLDLVDDCSASQFQVSANGADHKIGMAYMQAVTPALSVGGQGRYSLDKETFDASYGVVYDTGDNMIAALVDKEWRLMYMRRVNPNRVHLTSELNVDKDANSTMSAGAEYTYKQGKIHFNVDSNLTIKSTMDTSLSPGITMQFSAETAQMNSQFKLGSGLSMG